MKSLSAKRLYHYWQELRAGRPAPERRDIDPGAIKHLLSDVFILEHEQRETFNFRLAGSNFCDVYCRELKGRAFRQFWSGNDLEALDTMMLAIREEAAAAVIGYEGINTRDQSTSFEMLLLPLRYGGTDYPRILGTSTAQDEPYWLGVHPIMRHQVTSMRLIWPDEQPAFLRQAANGDLDLNDDLLADDPFDMTNDHDFGIVARQNGLVPSQNSGVADQRRQAFRVIEGGRSQH